MGEVFLSISAVIEIRTHNNMYTAVGFFFISFFSFPFLILPAMLSLFCYLDVSKFKVKKMYYKIALSSLIFSIVTILLVIGMNIYLYYYP